MDTDLPTPVLPPTAEDLLEALRRYALETARGLELADMERRLLQMQKMMTLGQVTTDVAHDFGNLMTVVLGYSELLLSTLPPGKPDHAHLEALHLAAERAADLTAQLLGYTREPANEPAALDLALLVRRLEPMLARLLGQWVRLDVFGPQHGCQIWADSRRIEQVVVNLVFNARDALRGAGRVTVAVEPVHFEVPQEHVLGTAPAGTYVALRVTDDGCGMDAAVRHHLFEPFFTTKDRGTGLGLAIVAHVAQECNAAITVDSTPNQGSTFTLYFPILAAIPSSPPNTPLPPALS